MFESLSVEVWSPYLSEKAISISWISAKANPNKLTNKLGSNILKMKVGLEILLIGSFGDEGN